MEVEKEIVLLFIIPRDLIGEFVLPIPTLDCQSTGPRSQVPDGETLPLEDTVRVSLNLK